MRALIENLRTAYINKEITLARLQTALANGKITQLEYDYIIEG